MTTSKKLNVYMSNDEKAATAAKVATGGGIRMPFGCTAMVLDLIGVAFVVSHVGTIWAALSRAIH